MNDSPNHIGTSSHKFTFSRVFSHSFLFMVQSIVYTMGNAVYQDILILAGIVDPNNTGGTPEVIGHMLGAFFLGKLLSDPFWGWFRDWVGDKSSLFIISVLLFFSLLFFGVSSSFWSMIVALALIGFNSGIYIPGTSFMNWVRPQDRDKLAMWVYIFAGGGALIGPFIGSYSLVNMPDPPLLWTYTSVGVVMFFTTLYFLWVFRDIGADDLILPSAYTKMEEIYVEKVKKEASRVGNFGMLNEGNSNTNSPNQSPWVSLNLTGSHLDANERESGLFRSRRKIANMDALTLCLNDSPRRNMVFINGISWMVQVMDWMLFSIWAVIAEEEGGLGLTALETGTISLVSFPIVTILLISFFPMLRKGRRTTWMMWCSFTFFVGMILVPIDFCPTPHGLDD